MIGLETVMAVVQTRKRQRHPVADAGAIGSDPIEALSPQPATVRPSWPKYSRYMRSLAIWRWTLTLIALAVIGLLVYEWAGWPALIVLPPSFSGVGASSCRCISS